eukprot:1007862-Prorocentrum_minimum.AAC.1
MAGDLARLGTRRAKWKRTRSKAVSKAISSSSLSLDTSRLEVGCLASHVPALDDFEILRSGGGRGRFVSVAAASLYFFLCGNLFVCLPAEAVAVAGHLGEVLVRVRVLLGF